MAKEKAAEKVTTTKAASAAKHQTTQHGTVKCRCNKCKAEVDVPTGRLYAKAASAVMAQAEKKVPALMLDGEEVRAGYTISAKPYIAKRQLQHRDISGGTCDGTFSTVCQHKPKTHKSSKQRHGNKE